MGAARKSRGRGALARDELIGRRGSAAAKRFAGARGTDRSPIVESTGVQQRVSWAQDFAAGCLVAVLGVGAAWIGEGYGVGTLQQMQPGFFPVAVGAILAV